MSKVSELAAICGVSEQALRKYFAQHGFRKLRNQWDPTKKQLEQLFSHYGVEEFSQPKRNLRNQISQPSQPAGTTLSGDDERWYREQIDALNKRCEDLARLLDQEQQLHAATKQELAALKAPEGDRVDGSRRPWWKRFFG